MNWSARLGTFQNIVNVETNTAWVTDRKEVPTNASLAGSIKWATAKTMLDNTAAGHARQMRASTRNRMPRTTVSSKKPTTRAYRGQGNPDQESRA